MPGKKIKYKNNKILISCSNKTIKMAWLSQQNV